LGADFESPGFAPLAAVLGSTDFAASGAGVVACPGTILTFFAFPKSS
jgi:hypothetical protein